jgi:hypothetical protein
MQRMEERIAHETKDIDADDVGGKCSGRGVTRTTLTSSFNDEHGVRCPNGGCVCVWHTRVFMRRRLPLYTHVHGMFQ